MATRIGIAVVEHQGRVLIGQRGESSPLAGQAEFPGGKCEPNETPADCAVRECLEETGLTIQPLRLLDQRTHAYPHGTVELHFWLCRLCEPADADANPQTFRWVFREELPRLNFPAANEHVLALLVENTD